MILGETLDAQSIGTIVQTPDSEVRKVSLTNVTQCWPNSPTPDNWFCFGNTENFFVESDSGGPVMVMEENRLLFSINHHTSSLIFFLGGSLQE